MRVLRLFLAQLMIKAQWLLNRSQTCFLMYTYDMPDHLEYELKA